MSSSAPFNVTAELTALRHEKKNQNLPRLPPNAAIQRRPINHAPIADARTGAKVPKIVYVSRRTPMMAAVKRVKKMLRHIEERALQEVGANVRSDDGKNKVAQANELLAKRKEEVLVKASGRAMQQALRVGEWFRSQEKEMLCDVEVRAGNVSVVDDIIEIEAEAHGDGVPEDPPDAPEDSRVECGETTLELLGDAATNTPEQAKSNSGEKAEAGQESSMFDMDVNERRVKTVRRKKKRTRPMYEEDELPEARIRWVKTVEVAISLKG